MVERPRRHHHSHDNSISFPRMKLSLMDTISLVSSVAIKDTTTSDAPSPSPAVSGKAAIMDTTTFDTSFTPTSSAFPGFSTVVTGEAVINGTQTMTQFVFLSMTRNLPTGTQSPTSLPSEVGAKNCNQQGGIICMWWWGSVGWGLCLSCTPGGKINPKIGRGTTITIPHPPDPPNISPPRCIFAFLCPNPPPGTTVQTVEGVEDEPPSDQPTVDVGGQNEDPEPSESQPAATASSTSTSSASSIPTSFAIYPNGASYTTTNEAFNSSLYQLADPSTVYVSVDEDVGILFWLADLDSEQIQVLGNYGVSFSNRPQTPTNSSSSISKIWEKMIRKALWLSVDPLR